MQLDFDRFGVDDFDGDFGDDDGQAFADCLAECVRADECEALLDEAVERSGAKFAALVARTAGFGQGDQRAAILSVVQTHRANGGDLQGLVDAANRTFERLRPEYYLGVGANDVIVLYSSAGIIGNLDTRPARR